MARLAHPSGEHGIAQAAGRSGALQIISNNASQTPEQIVAGAAPGQVFGWQLYVQTDRSRSEAMLRRVHKLPQIRFVCLTLDAAGLVLVVGVGNTVMITMPRTSSCLVLGQAGILACTAVSPRCSSQCFWSGWP